MVRADGSSLFANRAFEATFGAAPSKTFDAFRSSGAAPAPLVERLRRAFAGEPQRLTAADYDVREVTQLSAIPSRSLHLEVTMIPLANAADAHRLMESGDHIGKIVLAART